VTRMAGDRRYRALAQALVEGIALRAGELRELEWFL
jgi:hypothetical protein